MNLNYYNTFITVAADCPVEYGIVPPEKRSGLTKAGIEYALAADRPYELTQEELLFETYARQKDIPLRELEAEGARLRSEFFAKPMACLRASGLPKKFGWGIHFDDDGKLALVPMESAEYREFVDGGHPGVKLLPAMRNSRK